MTFYECFGSASGSGSVGSICSGPPKSHPDPLGRGKDPRIRICIRVRTKMSRIHNIAKKPPNFLMCFYQADCNGLVNKNFMKDIRVSCTKQYLSVSPPLGSPKKEIYKYCLFEVMLTFLLNRKK
jgi:hypothetical protein